MSDTANALFRLPCDFVKGVVDEKGLPTDGLPEIAFAGRSNVGKSTLINALFERRSLAKTSGTPGHTRQLNFFKLADQYHMVDMPGYGYAKASKSEVVVWQKLIKDYLRGRQPLRRVFLLIDARHGVKAVDEETMELMDITAMSYQIVLTKIDKLSHVQEREAVIEKTKQILAKHGAAHPQVLATSSASGFGMEELREAVLAAWEGR